MELDPVVAAEKIFENDSIKDSDILDVIEHYGIEGQKWGVRNGPPYPLERKRMSASEKRAQKLEDKNKQRAYLSKRDKAKIVLDKSDDLSIEELRQAITRIELEEKLKTFNTEKDRREAKNIVEKSLASAGTKVLTTVIAGASFYAIYKVLDKKFGADVAKAIVGK